ncbi:hypothetical protein A7J50_1163 [Pseudomonas antarctica]|uniref:Uncharacterized protein n=1 Tax=Pseudomonas antarctica TaxID=219572 RepID=A0A172YWY7_9PSED|nr:hypothetical protein [Pseudomonas antarctica]ANF84602.1 hypothetical protein A7J50_1163 [Pseudomonas antarctica]
MDEKASFKKTTRRSGGFLTWQNIRDLSLLLLFIAIAYRLAVTNMTIDLSGFGFTDLLSLILAISAIVLSAAFYFKADESSKSFYNNSYEFTKNISELLGRIEERFGAQLVSINKGYDDLNSKLNSSPEYLAWMSKSQDEEIETIKRVEGEYQTIIEGLMEKAKLDDAQKANMSAQMTKLKSEADHAKSELSKLVESSVVKENVWSGVSEKLFDFLSGFVGEKFGGQHKTISYSAIADRFNALASQGFVPGWVIGEMYSIGFIRGGALTLEGAEVLSRFISRFAN